MGAKLVLHDKVVLSLEEIVEIKIWKVPRSEEYPEGFKYSLVYVKKGKRILGYDNYHPKSRIRKRRKGTKPGV